MSRVIVCVLLGGHYKSDARVIDRKENRSCLLMVKMVAQHCPLYGFKSLIDCIIRNKLICTLNCGILQ